MKKLNLKSLLALLLTLAMLLGGVSALADGETATTDATATDPATVAPDYVEPEAPTTPATDPTVTVTADGDTVNLTVTDIATLDGAENIADFTQDINWEYDEEKDDWIDEKKTDVEIADNEKLITADSQKLLDAAKVLNIDVDDLTAILNNPAVEEEYTYKTVDEDGNEVTKLVYTNDVRALLVGIYNGQENKTITLTGGDVYAATSTKNKDAEGKPSNYSDLDATGADFFNYEDDAVVNAAIDSAFAKADAPETAPSGDAKTDEEKAEEALEIQNSLHAYANAASVTARNGGTTHLQVENEVGSVANAKNGDAYSTAESAYSEDKGSDVALKSGDATAIAKSESDYARANAFIASGYDEATLNAETGDLTTYASGKYEADSTGASVYSSTTKGVTVKTGSIDATANVTTTNTEKHVEDGWMREPDASAVGASVYSSNGYAYLEVDGDINSKSTMNAYGVSASSYGGGSKWDEEKEESVPVTEPGSATVVVNGDINVQGKDNVIAVSAYARTGSEWDEEAEEYVTSKAGGTAKIVVNGDVTAAGDPLNKKSDEAVIGVNAYAGKNAKTIVAITGDVTGTGSNSYGLAGYAEKGGKVDMLVDGTVSGGDLAIAVKKSTQTIETNNDGDVWKSDREEYDPTAMNIIVWKAEENANGRIATVYDETIYRTQQEKAVEWKNAYGEQSTNLWDTTVDTAVDEKASAALEQAIWYIIKVADKWQDKVTATGTGTYTLDDTTYQLAHQDDNVTLNLNISSRKKLSAIYYNDGTKAEYVKNADGTYTIKMLRGGAMELSLKLKNKYKDSAATTSTSTSASTASTEAVAEEKNWAYGIEIEGVGTIYYARDYFALDDIVNPLTKEPYTEDEIKAIVDGAKEGAEGYIFDIPEKAMLGMNDFWYDADAAKAITSHEDALTIGDDGVFTTADGEEVAKPMA